MIRLALPLAIILAGPAHAEPWPICDQGQPRTACAIDADSIWYLGTKIRFAGTDAPETEHAHCPAELAAGERATRRLADLLGSGPVEIHPTGLLDRYGRMLATVTVDGADVEDTLIAEGLSLPYRSGKANREARTAHWCGESKE